MGLENLIRTELELSEGKDLLLPQVFVFPRRQIFPGSCPNNPDGIQVATVRRKTSLLQAFSAVSIRTQQEHLVVVPHFGTVSSIGAAAIDHCTPKCRHVHLPFRLGHFSACRPHAQCELPRFRLAIPKGNSCAELDSRSAGCIKFVTDLSRVDPHRLDPACECDCPPVAFAHVC